LVGNALFSHRVLPLDFVSFDGMAPKEPASSEVQLFGG
jgi:hypothetical protein